MASGDAAPPCLGLRQAFQKSDERLLILRAEVEAAVGVFGEIRIERLAPVYPAAVVRHDFGKGVEAAVVHVGGALGDIPQGGGAEFGAVGFLASDAETAEVFGRGEAVVVELVIGEERAAVAVETVGSVLACARVVLGHEELEAAAFRRGECGLTTEGSVELGIVGGEREEELLHGEADLFGGDLGGIERGGEERGVTRIGGELGDDVVEFLVHLGVILDGEEDLLAKGRRAAIPEEERLPGEIYQRHAVARAGATFDADTETARIGEAIGRQVAGGAGDGAIAGELGIVEELAAEGHAFVDERIVPREGRQREGAADGEAIGGELRRQVERANGRGWGGRRWEIEEGDAKGAGEVCHERSADGISLARVGGDAILGKAEWAGSAQERAEIEVEKHSRIAGEIEGDGEIDPRAAGIAGEVIDKPERRITPGAVVAFQREEDVAALPAPVEPVQVGIERIVRGEFGGIGGIVGGGEADIEAEGAIVTGGDAAEGEGGAAFLGIEESVALVGLDPATVVGLQGEAAEEIADASEGERLARAASVAEGIEEQRLALEAVLYADLQRGRLQAVAGDERQEDGEAAMEKGEAHGRER